jgi:hypothetical protein
MPVGRGEKHGAGGTGNGGPDRGESPRGGLRNDPGRAPQSRAAHIGKDGAGYLRHDSSIAY